MNAIEWFRERLTHGILPGARKMYVEALNALEQVEAEKWHDLRKNPDDLPADDNSVIVSVTGKHGNVSFFRASLVGSYCPDDGWLIEGYDIEPEDCARMIKAWKRIDVYEGAE